MVLLQEALDRVRDDMDQMGKLPLFEALKHNLTGDSAPATYAELAPAFGLTENGLTSAAHRMRERFCHHLRVLVADTVQDHNAVDDEIRHIFSCFSR